MSIAAPAAPAIRVRIAALTNRGLLIGISALMFLPSAVFATGLRTVPALLVLAGCCGALAVIASGVPTVSGWSATFIDHRRFAASVAFATALLLLGGETHLFFPPWDWTMRDAVLNDLVRHGFPVGYHVGDADYILRAPLGMYMAPAIVGKVAGVLAAHVALLAQNAVLLGAIFHILASLGAGWRLVLILVFFSGLSIVGTGLRTATVGETGTPFWLLWGLDSWHPIFQYSGTLVQFFWVPNHALPGWWLATLLLLQVRGQVDIATVGASVAGALLWSPLSVIPVAPWLIWCALRDPRALLASRTIAGAVSAAGFLPVLVYLLLAASSISGGSPLETPDFVTWYLLFVTLALAPLGFLLFARRSIPASDRGLLVFSALVLFILPFFRFGPNNDLVMRGSLVALTIVAFSFGNVVVGLTRRRAPGAIAGWLLVAACAPSAFVELGRAVLTPSYAISDCSVMEAATALGGGGLPTNYIAPTDLVPAWLIDTQRTPFLASSARSCWLDRVGPRFFGVL